jgi:hypothetical protein
MSLPEVGLEHYGLLVPFRHERNGVTHRYVRLVTNEPASVRNALGQVAFCLGLGCHIGRPVPNRNGKFRYRCRYL